MFTMEGDCFGLLKEIKDKISGLDKSGLSDSGKGITFRDSLVPSEMTINWPSKSSANSESSDHKSFLESRNSFYEYHSKSIFKTFAVKIKEGGY